MLFFLLYFICFHDTCWGKKKRYFFKSFEKIHKKVDCYKYFCKMSFRLHITEIIANIWIYFYFSRFDMHNEIFYNKEIFSKKITCLYKISISMKICDENNTRVKMLLNGKAYSNVSATWPLKNLISSYWHCILENVTSPGLNKNIQIFN